MSDLKVTPPKGPTVLCILDGFGYREEVEHNAIKQASMPIYEALWQSAPRAMVATSGLDVGLPDGQMGNSEVGHMNIGAGRIVLQDLPRIDAESTEPPRAPWQRRRPIRAISTLFTSSAFSKPASAVGRAAAMLPAIPSSWSNAAWYFFNECPFR